MDTNSLILGLAGIFATLVVGGLGLFFNYKERNSIYRETVYNKQIEYIINCFEQMNSVQRLINIHHQNKLNSQSANKIYSDFLSEAQKFSTLVNKSSAILPTDIYTILSDFAQFCEDYFEANKTNNTNSFNLGEMHALNLKFGLTSREYLGIDKLSNENKELATDSNFEILIKKSNSWWSKFAKALSKNNLN